MRKPQQLPRLIKQNDNTVVNNRAVIYSRIAEYPQNNKINLAYQVEKCIQFAEKKQLNIASYFESKQQSGLDTTNEIHEIIEYCKQNNIAVIIVCDYMRLSRLNINSILKEIEKNKIRVLSVNTPPEIDNINLSNFFTKYE